MAEEEIYTFEKIEQEVQDGNVLSAVLVRNVFKKIFDLCQLPASYEDGTGLRVEIKDDKFVFYNLKGVRGEAGPKGEKGEAGPGYRFQGEYSAADTYMCDGNFIDTVRYNGNLYVCKSNGCVGKLPTESGYWGLMAERGEKGEPGQNAVVGEANGMVYFDVNADGDLIAHCNDEIEVSHYSIENGELIYRIE